MKNLKNFLKNWYYGAYRKSDLAIKSSKDLREAKQQAGVTSENNARLKILEYGDAMLATNCVKLIESEARELEQNLEYDKAIAKYELIYKIYNDGVLLLNVDTEDLSEIERKLNRLIGLKYLKDGLVRAEYGDKDDKDDLKSIILEADARKRIEKFKERFLRGADIVKEGNGAVAILSGGTLRAFNGDMVVRVWTGYHGGGLLSTTEDPEISYVGKDKVVFRYTYGVYGRESGSMFIVDTGKGSGLHYSAKSGSYSFERPQNLSQLKYKEKADRAYQNDNMESAAELYVLARQYDRAIEILTDIKKKYERRQKDNVRLAAFRALPTPRFRNVRTDNPYDYNPGGIPPSVMESIGRTKNSIDSVEKKIQLIKKLSADKK